MTAASTRGTVLYYPSFRPNEAWLKAALLYWDRVRCIVPDSADDDENEFFEDSSEDWNLLRTHELVVDTSPEKYLLPAEKHFDKVVLPWADLGTKGANFRDAVEKIRPRWDAVAKRERIIIHSGKRRRARNLAGLNRFVRKQSGEWLTLPRNVGMIYLMCLAKTMSEELKVPLATDTAVYASAGQYLAFGQPAAKRAVNSRRNILLRLGLGFPSPAAMKHVPLKEIIRFRKSHADERSRFREHVESIVREVANCADPAQLDDYLADERLKIQRSISQYRLQLDELRVRSVVSALNIACPTMISSAAANAVGLIGPVATAVTTGTGLAISAVAWWADVRERKRNLRGGSTWHYALLARGVGR